MLGVTEALLTSLPLIFVRFYCFGVGGGTQWDFKVGTSFVLLYTAVILFFSQEK